MFCNFYLLFVRLLGAMFCFHFFEFGFFSVVFYTESACLNTARVVNKTFVKNYNNINNVYL